MISPQREIHAPHSPRSRPVDPFGLEIEFDECEHWRRWRRWSRLVWRWGLWWQTPWMTGIAWLRRSRWFAAGLICLLMGISAWGLSTWLLNEERLVLRYRRAAAQAMSEHDWERATTLLRRLIVLRPEDPDLRFLEARITSQSNPANAFQSISELVASADREHLPAHRWLAKVWFETDSETLQSWGAEPLQRRAQIGRHVRAVLRSQPEDREARRLLAELMVEQDPAGALAIFEALAQDDACWWLRVASICRQIDDHPSADRALERWIECMRSRLESPHACDTELALWVGAHIELQQCDQIESWLRRFESHFSPETVARCRSTLIAAALEQSMNLSQPADLPQALDSLQRALEIDAGNPLIYRIMSRLIKSHGALRSSIESLCREQVAAGIDSGLPHLILGILAHEQGETRIAVERFEIALQHDPRDVVALNNLAWILAHGPQGDLEQAQRLIELAIQARSDLAALHETAGSLQLLQGDFMGATVAFERAMRRDPTNPRYLVRCAECYEQRGDTQQAETLRARAIRIRDGSVDLSPRSPKIMERLD